MIHRQNTNLIAPAAPAIPTMPSCLVWGESRHEECSQTEDQGYNECSATEDQGYNACSQSEDQGHNDCCDWWPCSWACDALVWIAHIVCVAWVWVSNVVCVAWTWVSHLVCVAWTWVTTAFCILVDVIVLVVNTIWTVVEGFFGVVLSAIAAIIELIEAIPFIGPIIGFIIHVVTQIIWVIVSIPDFILGVLGIRPEKRLRICTIILKDEAGNFTAQDDVVIQALQLAADVYKRDANVRLVPMGLFKFREPFSGADTVTAEWLTRDANPSSADFLDGTCAEVAINTNASNTQLKMISLCFVQGWRRVVGYGAPVSCFIVRDMPDRVGCCNQATDYVRVDSPDGLPPSSPRTIGHETGHSCLLSHTCVDDDVADIMATTDECTPASMTQPDRMNPHLTDWEALVIRASKHVTYF